MEATKVPANIDGSCKCPEGRCQTTDDSIREKARACWQRSRKAHVDGEFLLVADIPKQPPPRASSTVERQTSSARDRDVDAVGTESGVL